MNRRSIGLILLLLGIVLLIGAGALGVMGVRATAESFRSLATFRGPATCEVTIPEADTYTLWHDHVTMHEGVSVNHPPALPSGYSFSLENLDTGDTIPLDSSSGSMTRTVNNRESSRLGSFEVPAPGPYRFTASQAAEDTRIFSLSRGGFGDTFRGIGLVTLCGLLGFLGLALAVTGLILFLVGRKPSSPPTLPAS